MKILFVHPSVELYGADKILLYILEILNKNQHELTVLLPKNGVLVEHIKNISSNIQVIINNDLPIVHSKLKFKEYLELPKKVFFIQKLFPKKSFDLVYCNTLATTLLLYTRWSKKHTIHIHEIIEKRILNFIFSLLICLRTKKVICVSKKVKDNLYFSTPYTIIHNGIPDISKDSIPNRISDMVNFVLPGRFMPKKGQWFLLDALQLLPKTYLKQIRVALYGSAPPNRPQLQINLRDEICKRNLNDIVIIKPFTSDISEIYTSADVILVPSLMADPFPTTVLEALMFSKPIICTNNGGAIEILDDKYAKIIHPNNKEEFAESLMFFIDKKEKIYEMGKEARKKYEAYLTMQEFSDRFTSFILE